MDEWMGDDDGCLNERMNVSFSGWMDDVSICFNKRIEGWMDVSMN